MSEALKEWILTRWDAEVAYRPRHNIYYRTLDETWRQIYRHVAGEELPRPIQKEEAPQ